MSIFKLFRSDELFIFFLLLNLVAKFRQVTLSAPMGARQKLTFLAEVSAVGGRPPTPPTPVGLYCWIEFVLLFTFQVQTCPTELYRGFQGPPKDILFVRSWPKYLH